MMSISLYQDIIKTIKSTKLRDCQDVLEHKYPTISFMTLGSVLGNYVQKSMRMNHGKHNTAEKIRQYYDRFKSAVANNEAPGVILRISDEIGITPVLVAKFVLEAYVLEQHDLKMKELEEEERRFEAVVVEEDDTTTSENVRLVETDKNKESLTTERTRPGLSRNEIKAEVNKYLKDTASIPHRHLSYEVYLCTTYDEHYGPLPDAIKRTVGKEYEVRLSKLLRDQGILYLEEEQLRKQGYDKTPDFKLEAPIAIDGKVITWIESKATFGDEETHQNYVKDQLTSYYNRFGPGLVIYWLGYVETILNAKTKGIYVFDHLPTSITKYDPDM